MAPAPEPDRAAQVVAAVEHLTGEPVAKLTCPGGRDRDIYRAYLPGRSVIVSKRDYQSGKAREQAILRSLAPKTRHFAQYIGLSDDGYLVQSDMGVERLGAVLMRQSRPQRKARFARALASITAYQTAIGEVPQDVGLRVLFSDPDRRRYFAEGPMRTAAHFRVPIPGYDPDAIQNWLAPSRAAFVKWDCRAANAAVAEDGTIGWFDFEDAGQGHAVWDLAWLACDEYLPLTDAEILPICRNAIRHQFGDQDAAAENARFDVFSALIIALRVRKIARHVAKRKRWFTLAEIDKSDRVGAHPALLANLLDRGALAAARHRDTACLTPMFQTIKARLMAAGALSGGEDLDAAAQTRPN